MAVLGGDRCKGPFLLKAKLLTPVCEERGHYLKITFQNLTADSLCFSVKGPVHFSLYNLQKDFRNEFASGAIPLFLFWVFLLDG